MALSLVISLALMTSGLPYSGIQAPSSGRASPDLPEVKDRVMLRQSSKTTVQDATIFTFAVERLADAEQLVLMPRVVGTVFDLRSLHLVKRANELMAASISLRREAEMLGSFTLEQVLKKMDFEKKAYDLEIEAINLKTALNLRRLRMQENASSLLTLPILNMKSVMDEDIDLDGETPSPALVFLAKYANDTLSSLVKVKLIAIPSEAVLQCISVHSPTANPEVMKLIDDNDLQHFRIARVKVLTGPKKGLDVFVPLHAITYDCPGVGQSGYIHTHTAAAFEADELRKYSKAVESGDKATSNSLLRRGRVLHLARGDQGETVVLGKVVRLRMLSGKFKDKILWVDRKSLSRYRL